MLSANRGFKTQAWVQEIEVSAGTVTCKKKHQLCADSAYPTQCKIDLPYLSGAFCCWQLARGQLDRQERRRLFGRHQSPISIAKTRKGSAAPFALAALRPCRRRRRRRLRNPNPSGYGNVRACVHTCARVRRSNGTKIWAVGLLWTMQAQTNRTALSTRKGAPRRFVPYAYPFASPP